MQHRACRLVLLLQRNGQRWRSNSNVVWIANYCAGQGIAGNMLYGLDSHLDGGSGISRSGTAGTLMVEPGTGGDLTYPWGIECCACGAPTGSCATTCTASGCTAASRLHGHRHYCGASQPGPVPRSACPGTHQVLQVSRESCGGPRALGGRSAIGGTKHTRRSYLRRKDRKSRPQLLLSYCCIVNKHDGWIGLMVSVAPPTTHSM